MKITAIDSAVLRIPNRKPIALDFPQHSLVVAHVRTDEGVTGLGYTLAFGGGGVESIQAYLDTRLAPLLMGQDPLLVERLWERMYRADRGIKRQGSRPTRSARSTSRCGTSSGKAAGLPLYKLWGAVTDRVAAYGSGGVAELLARRPDRRGGDVRGARMPLLQAEDPQPRPAGQPGGCWR